MHFLIERSQFKVVQLLWNCGHFSTFPPFFQFPFIFPPLANAFPYFIADFSHLSIATAVALVIEVRSDYNNDQLIVANDFSNVDFVIIIMMIEIEVDNDH